MALLKGILSKILENQKTIIQQNKDIREYLKTDEIIVQKAKKWDEVQPYLKKIPIFVSKIYPSPQEPLTGTIIIEYGIAKQTLTFDLTSGKLTDVPETFKAINALNLLSMKDYDKVQKGINDEKQRIADRNK